MVLSFAFRKTYQPIKQVLFLLPNKQQQQVGHTIFPFDNNIKVAVEEELFNDKDFLDGCSDSMESEGNIMNDLNVQGNRCRNKRCEL